jgi:hypothetical protein
MHPAWRGLLVVVGTIVACRPDDSNVVRGKGLELAMLPAPERARVYEAAVRGAFQVDESLSLLLDSRLLPREVGLASAGVVPANVRHAMEERGVIRGVCEPSLDIRGVPLCEAALPGYIVRYSPVFALKPDSVQVYIYVQKYDIPHIEASQTLRFERVYQVVRRGDDWRAVREGRVPTEFREPQKR